MYGNFEGFPENNTALCGLVNFDDTCWPAHLCYNTGKTTFGAGDKLCFENCWFSMCFFVKKLQDASEEGPWKSGRLCRRHLHGCGRWAGKLPARRITGLKVKLEYTLSKTNSELFAPEIELQPSIFRCYCWWFRNPVNSPVEVGSLSHHLQGFIHPRWCRISSINSMLVSGRLPCHCAGDGGWGFIMPWLLRRGAHHQCSKHLS